jgi:hypothetical protein
MGMRRFFWRRGGEAELAARLKRRRQRARPEFVNELAREVRSAGGRRFVPSRVLLAAALTFVMLVALASVGGSAGAGIRAQLVSVVYSVNKKVTSERATFQRSNDDDDDGDDDQYEEDSRECGLALQQAHESFHQQSFTWREHRLYHQGLGDALEDCGGEDGDD